MTGETLDDHQLARELADQAGVILLELRKRAAELGASSYELKAAGDRGAHVFLLEELRRRRPADGVLSEEADDDTWEIHHHRVAASRCWIVDPLDGTREFGEPGRPDWAVHVALSIDTVPVVGAVALPAMGITYGTDTPPPLAPPNAPLRIVVSRSRPPMAARRIAAALGAELVPLGSAGAKAMAVVSGAADAYVHAGGQYEWDSCAPVAVAQATGLWCSRLDGSPLKYNQPDPYLPDLLICRPELAEQALHAAEWLA